MSSRLVVGTGSPVLALVSSMPTGTGTVHVVTDDTRRAETLRSEGATVTVVDSIDRAALADIERPDSAVVAGRDPESNATAARLLRAAFPEVFLVCYLGTDADDDQRERLERVSNRVVDPTAVVSDRLSQVVGEDGARTRQLQRVFRDIDGHLAVVSHDNPDPDAIASAVALGKLAERAGCTAEVCYYGDISHQENRAFVNLLEYDLVNLDPGDDEALEKYDGFALVDHSRAGVNDQLPEDLPIDIVIDHHPPRLPVEARYVDLRSGVGATSTLLVDYFERLDVEIPRVIATGLLFGIRVDTKDFQREVSAEDFTAAANLVSRADMDALQRIEDPSVSAETLSTIGRAIDNRQEEGSVLLSCVGYLSDRDSLAQAADQLLELEGVHATMVYGVLDGTIYVSARARGADIDLGEVLRDAFGQIGSAGGHADMAGAQITLGVLESVDERDESLREIVSSVVNDRFLDAVESRSHRLLGGVYDQYGAYAGARPPEDGDSA
jgi:nanoRNase/pAp phosphatase (c-di-AMP/oligoRNAs hydrolase)